MQSRSIPNLCCTTQATLFSTCLSEDDLSALGFWGTGSNESGFSPAVWCRALLHKVCRRDNAVSQRVSDLLDLRHVDTISTVRHAREQELESIVRGWLRDPDGHALPGLLWALCTDLRPEVHALGIRLSHEATTVAVRRFVRSAAPRPVHGEGS